MRKTHPNLYRTYIVYALLSIALGLNFLFLTPAFMPLGVSKWPIGMSFLSFGLLKLTLLLVSSNHTCLRLSLALGVASYTFWAGALTFDFVRLSQTSMQLPLTYIGLATLGFFLLTEPFTNPATSTEPIASPPEESA